MAVWYVGSVQYTAVAQFAISTAYVIGNIVRQLAAPAVDSERCFRCTTAGTSAGSEPSWNLGVGATTTSGTAVFTEVTGNSTYNWAAPCATLVPAYNTRAGAGDTVYVAQNHAETRAAAFNLITNFTSDPIKVICVNAAGSVPPVPADIRATATISTTGGSADIGFRGYAYIQGVTFSCGSSSGSSQYLFGSTNITGLIFQDCNMTMGNTNAGSAFANASACRFLKFINTPFTFGAVGQKITASTGDWVWQNTPSAIGGSVPTTLILMSGGATFLCDGVDLSAASTGKTLVGDADGSGDVTLLNCKIDASVTIAATRTTRNGTGTNVVITDSGANAYRQELHAYTGDLTTETTFVLSGAKGASDGVTPISWKVVTTANARRTFPFECFMIPKWNTVTGTPITVTVEIENGGVTLTDADINFSVEYLGNASYPISSIVSSGPATQLTTPANLSTSSETWAGGLGSAVKQYMQVTFTPQMVGYIRAVISVGRASTTLYINPKLI